MKDGPLGGDGRAAGNTSPAETAASVTDKIAKRGLHAVKKSTQRLERLAVEYVALDSIRPNTYNPNRQDKETLELLKSSMTEDGFTQPVVVHRETRQIVDGEHRWRAARSLGMTQIPVVFVEMSEEQMRIATLRHNRARGSEDIELSNDVLRDLQELGAIDWAADSLMLTDAELNEMLSDIPAPEALADEVFSEAWTPERGDATQGAAVAAEGATTKLTEGVEGVKGTGRSGVAMTKAAAEEVILRKERLEKAQGEAERTRISQSMDIPFRLQFVFSGEEAELVKAALGDEPAETLLVICTELDEATQGE